MLLLAGFLFSCTTEVAEFDSLKEAKQTAEQEEKEAKKEEESKPKEKDVFERQKNPDTLTFKNNEEFKNILTGTVTDEEYNKFFTDNKYNIVEFDGAIDVIELIDGKKTRYSLLLRSGDYNPDTVTGPPFLVKDVGATDPSVKPLFLSGNGEVGKNVRVVAKIYGFDKEAGTVELKLQSLTLR